MARLGRPTKLTQDIQTTVCESLERGNYLETAAALSGITTATVRNWVRKGTDILKSIEAGDKITAEELSLADFTLAIQKAQAVGEARHLGTIDEAAQLGNWNAAAWMLERKTPERWGRREQIEVEMDLKEVRRNIAEALGIRDFSDLDE